MWPILILTGVAAIFFSLNRISTLPRPERNLVSRDQQAAWQADLHFATALQRLKDSIEQSKPAVKNPKRGTLLLATTNASQQVRELERYLAWLQSVKGTYTNLMEEYGDDAKRQKKLLKDWQRFTDAVWAQSNTDQWQEVYLTHGLAVEDSLYENAKLYSQKAEETANHLLSQIHPA